MTEEEFDIFSQRFVAHMKNKDAPWPCPGAIECPGCDALRVQSPSARVVSHPWSWWTINGTSVGLALWYTFACLIGVAVTDWPAALFAFSVIVWFALCLLPVVIFNSYQKGWPDK